MPSTEERFRAKVKRRADHEVWTGSRDQRGVGMVRIDGKLKTVQRAAWELAYGPLDAGVRVNTCATERACVTIAHLSLSGSKARTPPLRRRRRGSGSLREVSPGTWELTVADRLAAGGRRFTTVHGSQTEAAAELARLVDLLRRDDLGDLRVRELVGRFLDTERSVTTRNLMLLREVIEPAVGDELAAISTPVGIEAAFDAVGRDGTPLPDVRDALRLLRSSYGWAIRQRWCDIDPTASIDTRWL